MPCLANIPCSCAAQRLRALLLTDAAPILTRTGTPAASVRDGSAASSENRKTRMVLPINHHPESLVPGATARYHSERVCRCTAQERKGFAEGWSRQNNRAIA